MSHETFEDAVAEIDALYGTRLIAVRYDYNPRVTDSHQVVINIQWPKAVGGLIRWAKGPTAYVAAERALLAIQTADV